MIDIKAMRETPELYKDNMKRKGRNSSTVDEVLSLDSSWRSVRKDIDDLRKKRNDLSKQANDAKKKGDNDTFQNILEEVKAVPAKIKELEEQESELLIQIEKLIRNIPNIMHKNVPQGKSDADNVELARFGPEPVSKEVKAHQIIAEELGVADFESSATTSGAGFYYLEGDLALLNQALLRYAIEVMVKKDFRYVETPLLIRKDIISKVTDIHDQENMIYKIEDEDAYLIGTSEHSLIGRYIDASIEESNLPLKQTSYSMCFRREKGSHGLDERGLFRTHQFNKVEMIVICKPEDSELFYKQMQEITIEIFTGLELPTRVLQICTGDLGDMKHTQVDIEVWSPRRNDWIEVGSCSNLTDAQARSLGIRTKGKDKFTPHTLNNTAMATSRALVAILENHQNEDGSITIPKVLRPWMFGKERIEKQ